MITTTLIQGTPEWKAYRASKFNASDAPAMLGCSPYKTRADLLRELHTGLAAAVDDATQRIFDAGHRFEALARPLAEQIIGEELYPVTGSEGRLSASFDGLTLAEDIAFEHKSANAELRAILASNSTTGADLPKHYRVQMEQQLMVSGAQRVLFMATLWDGEECTFSGSCWYYPDEELRAEILCGWEQFAADLAGYTPLAKADPAPSGRSPDSLPALLVQVTGMVTASSLDEFKATALAAIAGVNRDLKTDQDFADAEKAVKWCGEVESRLAAAKEHALAQTASIDELFRTMDGISAEARRVRLDLDKLVKARKEAIKGEIVAEARRAYELHEDVLRTETGGPWIALTPPDFAGAIKGLRTVDSIRNAVDTTLAQAKIRADESARKIRESLRILAEDGAGFEFLFSDRLALVGKAPEYLRLVVSARIAAHKEAEEKRLEAERERIRAEEVAKAQREAQQAEQRAMAAADVGVVAAPAQYPAPAAATPVVTQIFHTGVVEAARQQAARTDEPATLKLGVICERLGFTVTAAFLADVLHVKHSATDKRAMLYRESDWPVICRQLASHVSAMAELYALEAA